MIGAPAGALQPLLGLLFNPAAASFPPSGGGLAFTLPDRKLRSSYALHFNLQVEREFLKDYLVNLAYVGSRGVKLIRFRTPNGGPNSPTFPLDPLGLTQGNTALPPAVALPPLSLSSPTISRPVAGLGAYTVFDSSAASSYHSLQASLTRRFSGGRQITAAYIFARNAGGADNWGQVKKLTSSDGVAGDHLGNSVGMSGSTVLIGADLAPGNVLSFGRGAAYIFLVNCPPVLIPQSISRQQGSLATVATIATVSDDVTAAGSISVMATTIPAGISLTGLTNTNGTITAMVSASCTAATGANTVVLQATDGNGLMTTANLTVNVTANTAPTLGTYPTTGPIIAGTGTAVTPSAAPTDNGTITGITASAPGFTGSFSVNTTTGVVTISNAGPVGNYTVTVTATDNCTATSSQTFALTVNMKFNSATALSPPSAQLVCGQPATFTATVSAVSPGTGTPTGSVTFKDCGSSGDCNLPGAITLGTMPLNNGQATLTTSLSPAGTHGILASYGGDSSFNGSESAAQSIIPSNQRLIVAKAASTSAVGSSAPSSVFGQAVTFTATVSKPMGNTATPSGTVTFKDGTATLGPGTLNNSGQATFTTAALSLGQHSITAAYAGDGCFDVSTSAAITQTVSSASTATAVVSSANPVVFGQFFTLTATITPVAPGGGTPTGTVQFKDNGTVLGGPIPLSGGAAKLSIAALAAGSHTITAEYSGDGNYNASVSATGIPLVINPAKTATAVMILSAAGGSVTLKATTTAVPPGGGTPTGTAQFFDGATSLGTTNLNTSGVAQFSATLAAGNHSITATYSGSPNFSSSTSNALTLTTTPVGSNVSVETAVSGNQSTVVTTTYSQVTAEGSTAVTQMPPSQVPALPNGFVAFASNALAFDVSTTAAISGPITLCFTISSVNDPAIFAALRVLHSEDGRLVDRTSSLNFGAGKICATVPSLGQFVIAQVSALTLLQTSQSFTPSGGAGSITVSAPDGVPWTASTDLQWVKITGRPSGSGNGTVSYTVDRYNLGAPRNGKIMVAGQTFTVYQGAVFGDVPETHSFYTFISKFSAHGITLGCGGGNFCPDDVVTREQMAIFIERSLGVFTPPTPTRQTFADVSSARQSYPFVEDLAARGITAGCGGGNFCPDNPVTRGQMAVFLVRAFGL